jgi:hypothetical protein
VRVAKAGGNLDLAQEPIAAERLGELGTKQLECDPPLMADIVGEIDFAHAARAKQRQDPIVSDCVPGGQHRS